jgi:hypothetical protein
MLASAVPRGVHCLPRLRALLTQAAEARGAGCHVGVLGAAPDSSAMTRAACHIFLCAPTLVDTHTPHPHDCSKGTITLQRY